MSRRNLFESSSFHKRNLRTLSFENLEVRQMLSANMGSIGKATVNSGVYDSGLAQAISFDTNTGRLSLNGDDGINNASVTYDTKATTSLLDDDVVASITRPF